MRLRSLSAMPGSAGWLVAACLIAAFAAVPLLAIAITSPTEGLAGLERLADTVLARYVVNTAGLMALTGLLATVIGVSTAWLVSACAFPGRRTLGWALVLPLAVPSYIAAYVYADLLDFSGPVQTALRAVTGWSVDDYTFPPIRSLTGGAVILALVLYPYIYLLARAAFATQSAAQFRAARSLGARPARAFRQVVLPAARPAIAGGLALVLMEVLADFGLAEYFAIPTFSTGIFRSWLAMGDKNAALGLAGLMLLFVAALVALEALTRRGRIDSRDGFADAGTQEPLVSLSPVGALGATLACAVPVALGFIVPALHLAGLAFQEPALRAASFLPRYAASSLGLGITVAVTTAALALVLVFAKTRSGHTLVASVARFATLGYALPGALLAVGLLAPLGALDQTLTGFARASIGYTGGLLLTGTSLILVYALAVRFLTVAYNALDSAMARIPTSLDAAARSLGAGPSRVLARVYLPLLRPSLLAALALVLIDTLRELPATLILRPFNLETLATRTYRLASDERLMEASIPALILLAVGLIPVTLLTRGRSH
ncbi:MAG: iron ABC transporter permease [Erythrobacter sp.]|uniref:ABC transporter permease n=1 Tax=Erythrobacter sp. TaxID=1042 RepID=UPI00262B451D|nr:iron ABC transporter permease [Erythrobacter sp.]MDJ0978588.1 iron ABC transporter permease [Erythrobacter sp.]